MRFIGRGFGANPPQSLADAKHVRIDGKRGFIEEKDQNTRDGFGADSVKLVEIGLALGGGQVVQKRQIEFAPVFPDFLHQLLDASGFLIGQSARANGIRDFLDGRDSHFLPGREGGFETGKGTVAVHVVGRLTEDNQHQTVERVALGRRTSAKFFEQEFVNASNCFLRNGGRGFGHTRSFAN